MSGKASASSSGKFKNPGLKASALIKKLRLENMNGTEKDPRLERLADLLQTYAKSIHSKDLPDVLVDSFVWIHTVANLSAMLNIDEKLCRALQGILSQPRDSITSNLRGGARSAYAILDEKMNASNRSADVSIVLKFIQSALTCDASALMQLYWENMDMRDIVDGHKLCHATSGQPLNPARATIKDVYDALRANGNTRAKLLVGRPDPEIEIRIKTTTLVDCYYQPDSNPARIMAKYRADEAGTYNLDEMAGAALIISDVLQGSRIFIPYIAHKSLWSLLHLASDSRKMMLRAMNGTSRAGDTPEKDLRKLYLDAAENNTIDEANLKSLRKALRTIAKRLSTDETLYLKPGGVDPDYTNPNCPWPFLVTGLADFLHPVNAGATDPSQVSVPTWQTMCPSITPGTHSSRASQEVLCSLKHHSRRHCATIVWLADPLRSSKPPSNVNMSSGFRAAFAKNRTDARGGPFTLHKAGTDELSRHAPSIAWLEEKIPEMSRTAATPETAKKCRTDFLAKYPALGTVGSDGISDGIKSSPRLDPTAIKNRLTTMFVNLLNLGKPTTELEVVLNGILGKTKMKRGAIAKVANSLRRNAPPLDRTKTKPSKQPPGPCWNCQSEETPKDKWHWRKECPEPNKEKGTAKSGKTGKRKANSISKKAKRQRAEKVPEPLEAAENQASGSSSSGSDQEEEEEDSS